MILRRPVVTQMVVELPIGTTSEEAQCNPVELRTGEDKTVEIQVKSNTEHRSRVVLSSNQTSGIGLSFLTQEIDLSPNGITTLPLRINSSVNSE
jgi:hypothetical protein